MIRFAQHNHSGVSLAHQGLIQFLLPTQTTEEPKRRKEENTLCYGNSRCIQKCGPGKVNEYSSGRLRLRAGRTDLSAQQLISVYFTAPSGFCRCQDNFYRKHATSTGSVHYSPFVSRKKDLPLQ